MCACLHQYADAGSQFQALCFRCTVYLQPHVDHVHKSKPCQRRPGPEGGKIPMGHGGKELAEEVAYLFSLEDFTFTVFSPSPKAQPEH